MQPMFQPRGARALALAAALGFAMNSAAAMPPDQVYAKVAPSVWRVIALDDSGKTFMLGSAVVVGKETMLTNCHVVGQSKHLTVSHGNVRLDATLQYGDGQRDMCQLKVPNLAAPVVELGNSDALAVGQRVVALGNPSGLDLTLSDGLVSALRKDPGNHLMLIQTTAPISPGSSGGGLFDEEGRLIGLTTMHIKDAQNLNFAVPVNWLRELPARSVLPLRMVAHAASAAPAPAPAPAPAEAPSSHAPEAPRATHYADINDTSKLAGFSAQVRASYEKFLTRPLPRAFAVSDDGGAYQAWSRVPRDPNDSPDPSVRALSECEKIHRSHCRLYAVDSRVVYRP